MTTRSDTDQTPGRGGFPSPARYSKRQRAGLGALSVVAALTLFAIVILVFLAQCTPRVPDVTGLDQHEALAKLSEMGYEPGEISEISSDLRPPGEVLEQAPEGGTVFGRGKPVDLIVVRGGDLIAVPDLIGNDTPAAQLALKAKKLRMNATGQHSPTVAKGAIIAQFPAAGSRVKSDSEVVVVVSLGPAPAQ